MKGPAKVPPTKLKPPHYTGSAYPRLEKNVKIFWTWDLAPLTQVFFHNKKTQTRP